MSRRPISIKHIAELAGVSFPTVSRALRGEGRMREGTRHRILAIARERGYTPSLVARSLQAQRSYALGLIVTAFTDPFHSSIAQTVEDEAKQRGYSLLMTSLSSDPDHEIEIARSLQGRRVDGILVSSGRAGDRYVDLFRETGIPIVLINSHAEDRDAYAIRHDDYGGGSGLMAHLRARGYRQVAYVGNAAAGRAQADRERAWRDGLATHGLRNGGFEHAAGGGIADGAEACQRLLEAHASDLRRPRAAIWCFNDAMALGALATLQRAGLRVPGGIGLAGFDDLDMAAYAHPPLTTWRQPRRAMATAAVDMLLALVEGREQPVERDVVMAGQLVAREST